MPTPQRMKYFHAASRLAGGPVHADQQDGGQRRRFHGHPQDAHVVGGQRQQHGEAEQLIHAVVETQPMRRHLAVVALDAHVRPREDGRGEADKAGQGDQKDVQRVDVELAVPGEQRPIRDHLDGQQAGGDESREAERDVDFARAVALPGERQHQAAKQGNAETKNSVFKSVFLELFEVADVETVELLREYGT
jgi:hypothetical protein